MNAEGADSVSAAHVAVIIPAFNAAPFLAQAIGSVQAQTVQDWELVLVDDGSTDNTIFIARQCAEGDPRIRVVRQENGGVSRARNRGLAELRSGPSCVAFLDADDFWEPHALLVLRAALDANPDAVGAHGVARFVDAAGLPVRMGEHEDYARHRQALVGGRFAPVPANAPTTFAALLCQNCIPSGGVLLRREAVRKAGSFDPALSPAEDWDYWLRVSAQAEWAFVNEIVYNYRQHGANASGQGKRMFAAQRRVRRKAMTCPAFTDEQRHLAAQACKLAEQGLARSFLQLAGQQMRRGQPMPALKLLRQSVISLCASAVRPGKG